MDQYIYHITNKFDYVKAKDKGFYDFCALKTEGFIHCSTKDQYLATANRYFLGKTNLILLKIETDKLNSKLVYENTVGGQELFPHLYGPISLNAVVSVHELNEKNGKFLDITEL